MSRAALPFLIVLLGIALTTLMALVQQDAAEREQELMFERAAELQRQDLSDSMSEHLHELEDAVGFISATFPSEKDEFRRYFRASNFAGVLSNNDPGVFVVESIAPNGVEALQAREHALGDDDFQVRFVGPRAPGDPLVITRTARDVSFDGIHLEGLEVSDVLRRLVAEDIAGAGQSIQLLDTDSVLAEFLTLGQIDEVNEPSVLLAATNPIPDARTGETVGWAMRLFDPMSLVTGLETDIDRRLNVELSLPLVGSAEILGETDEALLFEDAHLAEELTMSTAGLDWTTRIWATRDFGVPIGLADQGVTWTFGFLVTSAVLLGAVWRTMQEYRLGNANLELQRARQLASTDSLTGLLNRQGFIDGVRALDASVSGTLFFIDLDGFKQVNDTHGHQAGDAVLREAAMLLSGQFRGLDLVGRFGGDEFAAFTPGLVDVDHHASLSQLVISSLASLEDDVSCSVGTTTKVAYDSVDVLELIRRADAAMYRAKQSGGGRFESSKHSRAA